MNKKVSFDFDSTLSLKRIQKYAKFLIDKGFEVHITTTRRNGHQYGIGFYDNSDLFNVSDKLGIKQEHVFFTNGKWKHEFLTNDFLFHIDDDRFELEKIKNIPTVNVRESFCINKCNKILGLK